MSAVPSSHLKELRSRERLLNLLLSKVLKRQLAPAVYQVIGELRLGFIALRARESQTRRRQLIDLINRQEPEALSQIIRAFNLYFSLINIAEEAIALRERRRAVQQGAQMWPGSFHDTLLALREQGVVAADLKTLFSQLCYLPVITAHPSEAKRRTIKGALRNIFLSIEALDDPRVRGMYRDEAIQQLSNQIHILWNTDEVRASKLDVSDEIRTGLSYFPLSLFQAVTQVYRNFTRSLADVYGPQAPEEIGTPSFLRFGSWIGGDRDGHPLVTTQVTAMAWRMQAQTAYSEYLRRLELLSDQLSYSIRLCRPSDAFMADLEQDVAQAGAMLGRGRKAVFAGALPAQAGNHVAAHSAQSRPVRQGGRIQPRTAWLRERPGVPERSASDPEFPDQPRRYRSRQPRSAGSDPPGRDLRLPPACSSTCGRNPAVTARRWRKCCAPRWLSTTWRWMKARVWPC